MVEWTDDTLFGRDGEIAEIRRSLGRPDIAGVVLVGAAGVGKTRLLDATLAIAANAGFATLRLAATRAAAEVPLAAMAPLFGDVSGEAGMAGLVRARHELAERAGGRPLLVGVDDAQLLDDASAVLVHQLASELVAFVVCTVRTGELPADPITALWKDGLAARLDVSPLDEIAVGMLAAHVLGGPVDPVLEHDVWARTEGNALYVRELVIGARDAGAVELVDGRWRANGDLPTSPRLADLVAHRLSGLSDEATDALGLVALAEPIGLAIVEGLVSADVLMTLDDQGLLEVTRDRRRFELRLAHPVYGDVVRQRLSTLRTRRLLGRLAGAIEQAGGRRQEDVLRQASWALDAGAPLSGDVAARAAREARRRHDLDLAERLAEAAQSDSPTLAGAIQLALARHRRGQHEAALGALDAIGAPTDPFEAAALDLIRAQIELWGGAPAETPRARLAGAADRLEPGSVFHDRVVASQAFLEASVSRPIVARELAAPLWDEGRGGPAAAAALVLASWSSGRPVAAVELGRAAEAVIEPSGGEDRIRKLLVRSRLLAMLDALEVAAMREECMAGWESAMRDGDLVERANHAMLMSAAATYQGQFAAARHWGEQADRLYSASNLSSGRISAAGLLGMMEAQGRNIEAAQRWMEVINEAGSNAVTATTLYVPRARAWLVLAQGEPDRARDMMMATAEEAASEGLWTLAVSSWFDVARAGDPQRAAAASADVPELDGSLAAEHRAIVAAATHDGAGLAAEAETLAAGGVLVLAAETAAAARDAYARAGDQRAAAAAGRRATELLDEVRGVATPWSTIVDSPSPLTRREREVAMLVAEGRSSREVADLLFLSVRTVESHLARVFDKLGVRTRADLAAVVNPMASV